MLGINWSQSRLWIYIELQYETDINKFKHSNTHIYICYKPLDKMVEYVGVYHY
jgi:hypothetical protein